MAEVHEMAQSLIAASEVAELESMQEQRREELEPLRAYVRQHEHDCEAELEDAVTDHHLERINRTVIGERVEVGRLHPVF